MMAGAEVVSLKGGAAPAPKRQKYAGDNGGGHRSGRRQPPRGVEEPELPMLPPDCPVTPLGKRKQTYFFLDELGELIDLTSDKVAQKPILSLFGRQSHLVHEYWPRYGAVDQKTGERKITGWRPELASEMLMAVCAYKGVFDPTSRVRGRGAHLHDDGALVLHCGDRILIGAGFDVLQDGTRRPREAQWFLPGEHGEYVYPTGARAPRPDEEEQGTQPGETLLGKFDSWHWKRRIDPVLLLGFVGSAMIGGALDWRAHVWITGDSATGKSTLQKLLEHLFDDGLIKSADATEAGVRQVLAQDTLPVALDEAEAEENSAKINALVKLARIASSADTGLRGGQDHKGHSFAIKSSFLFSSVLMPAMLPQDRNRLAILELQTIPIGVKPPALVRKDLRDLGAQIRGRLFDQWPRFQASLDDFRRLLADHGHAGRSADQFGTLLACADLLLHDHDRADGADAEEQLRTMEMWASALAPDRIIERSDEMSNAERCVDHLASSMMQGASGRAPESVRAWITRSFDGEHFAGSKSRLGAVGLRIVRVWHEKADGEVKVCHGEPDPTWTIGDLDKNGVREQLFLAVCSGHRGLDPLFKDTPWQGRAAASGGWGQALRRINGAIAGERVRVDGKTQAVTLVPLTLFADLTFERQP